MPYIEPDLRRIVDPHIKTLVLASWVGGTDHLRQKRDGVLNYIITRLISCLYKTSYTDLNAAIGVLECAKQELYRRRLAPYENAKMAENGDVYHDEL